MRAARAAGDRQLAAALARLRRPTVSAWLLNLLVRDQPEVAEQLIELGGELRRAQEQLSGDALRELAAQRQRLVTALVRSARRLAAQAGHPVGAAVALELEQTLHAALADPDVAAEVGSGRLAKPAVRTGFEAQAPAAAPVRRLRAVRDDERAEDPAVVRERRRRELDRERLQAELEAAERVRDEQEEALAEADERLAEAERRRSAAEEAAEDLRSRLAEAEDTERDALRDEREAQRARDGIARRRDGAVRKAGDLAARLADLDR